MSWVKPNCVSPLQQKMTCIQLCTIELLFLKKIPERERASSRGSGGAATTAAAFDRHRRDVDQVCSDDADAMAEHAPKSNTPTWYQITLLALRTTTRRALGALQPR